jgi:hypothetical protein
MKTLKTLALTVALLLTGYAYATADTQTTNDQATTKAACCADQSMCSKDGKSCCAEGAACCKEGAACCKEGAACCADHAACCKDGAACCKTETSKTAAIATCCKVGAACCKNGATCCAARRAADQATAKAHKAAGKSAKSGCCGADGCQMKASGK